MAGLLPSIDLEMLQIIIDIHPSGELIIRTPQKLSTDTAIAILEAGAEILGKRIQEPTIH